MPGISRRQAVLLAGSAAIATPAIAQTKQSPGVTATEILLGQTMPYSGPASSYAPIGHVEVAYTEFINDQGGINGRKIKLLSLDDGYSPPKTLEQTRRLVEEENVAFIYQPLGTPTSMATRRYLNQKQVPQLFVASGATQFGDRDNFPWTMGWQISYQIEGRVYARYVMSERPDAKIAILYQNDDSGKDFLKGFKDGLGDKVRQITAAISYEPTDPTVDSQIVQLQGSGADTLFAASIPKVTAMALRKVREMAWNPLYIIASVGASVSSGLAPAGLDKAIGLITGAYLKDPSDPQWADDPGFKDWLAFMKKYQPNGDLSDGSNVYGYSVTQTLAITLKQCGENLSRDNVIRQAANLDIELPMLHRGIRFHTTPTDYYGIKKMRLQRFDGKAWVPFGEPIGV
jgi:ABC-type branched-subunit amino acid transport system substrate-binding protein